MKKVILFVILCITTIGTMFSQTDESKKSNFQLSLFPPLSTNGKYASQYTNKYSVNILVGISQNETLLTFGGLANIIHNNSNGVQFAGLANYVGNTGNGLLFAGLLNRSGDYNGIQLAGLINAANNLNGIQFAGLTNKADDLNGIQVAGLGNIAKNVNGFQISGFANVARDVNGFQFAGFINKAKHVEGFQFSGMINIADHSDYPLGLINLIKDGEKSIGIAYNEIGSTVLAFRSGGRVLYGILGVGYNHKSAHDCFVSEAGFGAHYAISPKFRINNELKGAYITSFSKDDETYHQSLSIMPAYKFASHFELFGGPSFNYLRSDNTDNTDLFPGNNIWRRFNSTRLQQVYFGFSIGTHILF